MPHSDFSFRLALMSSQDSGIKKKAKKFLWYYFNKKFSLLTIRFPKHELSFYTSVLFLQVARNIHGSFFYIAALLTLNVDQFRDRRKVVGVYGRRNRNLIRLDWLLVIRNCTLSSHNCIVSKLISPTEHVGYWASHHHSNGWFFFTLQWLWYAVFD